MDQKAPPTSMIEPRDDNTGRLVPISVPTQSALSTLRQIRKEMAVLYRAARRGDISTEELKGSIYALSQIAKLIEIGKLEERMEALEKMAIPGEWAH